MEHEILAREQDSELRMCLSYEVPSGIYAALTHTYVIKDAMEELVEAQIQAIRNALERQ